MIRACFQRLSENLICSARNIALGIFCPWISNCFLLGGWGRTYTALLPRLRGPGRGEEGEEVTASLVEGSMWACLSGWSPTGQKRLSILLWLWIKKPGMRAGVMWVSLRGETQLVSISRFVGETWAPQILGELECGNTRGHPQGRFWPS